MAAKDFANFVARQQHSVGPKPDWAKEREDWLKYLNSLYKRVSELLREYIDAGSISYTFSDIKLTEEHIGTYTARKMNIRIGRQRVSLVPVGTLLIGSKGRVDIEGSAGRALLLLVDERVKGAADLIKVTISTTGKLPPPPPKSEMPVTWAWRIVAGSPQRKFLELDKENFHALLMEVANG